MTKNNEITKEDIIEPLKGAIDYLDQIFLNKELISEALDEENYEVAWNEFNHLISGIETLNDLLVNVKSIYGLDYNQLYYKGSNLNEYIKDFNLFLSDELMIAMENKDYVLVSDLINYELQKYLKQYQKVFIFLLDYVKKIKMS